MIWRILLLWLLVANTAYGSVPGHRPVAYGYGVDYLTSSVWRERAVDPTGLYWLGDRYYDPISSQWLSHDHSWNDRDPNGQSYCGGDPVQGTDPKGKCVQNPPPALYFGTAPVMQEYTATTRYFQNGTSATTGLPGQSEQMYDPAQVTGNSYNLVTMPTGWDFSYVSEHPLPANYGQTTTVPITQADVAMQQGDQYIKAVATLAAFDVGGEFFMGGDAFAAETRLTSTVGDLRAAGLRDAHHVVQDAAVRDLPGYNTQLAPGVQLPGPSTAVGTPHYIATQVQRQAGGGTLAAEMRIGYKALRQAGYSEAQARQIIAESDAYFRRIGATPSTPTRIPGNR